MGDRQGARLPGPPMPWLFWLAETTAKQGEQLAATAKAAEPTPEAIRVANGAVVLTTPWSRPRHRAGRFASPRKSGGRGWPAKERMEELSRMRIGDLPNLDSWMGFSKWEFPLI